jgi:hypothetical protein
VDGALGVENEDLSDANGILKNLPSGGRPDPELC